MLIGNLIFPKFMSYFKRVSHDEVISNLNNRAHIIGVFEKTYEYGCLDKES